MIQNIQCDEQGVATAAAMHMLQSILLFSGIYQNKVK